MKKACLFVLLVLAQISMVAVAWADGVHWQSHQGDLVKEGFTSSADGYEVSSDEGQIAVSLRLTPLGTDPGLFSYSKWEIDRWGDPAGVILPEGSWHVASNSSNDVVLGLWGYWGWTGEVGAARIAPGDETSYQLSLRFDRPVEGLNFSLHGVNAVLREEGFNSTDIVSIESFLLSAPQPSPTYSHENIGYIRDGDQLTGDFSHPVNGQGEATNDLGSISLEFGSAVDEVVIRFTGRAHHPDPASFGDELQGWAFSLGNLHFDPVPDAGSVELDWASSQGEVIKSGFDRLTAGYQVEMEEGINVNFELRHLDTSRDLFTYSKWEVDRWGDPTGIALPPGSWQVVSNATNDVVLGLWGYWGWDGDPNSPRVKQGDHTSYQLAIRFNRPVSQLSFPLHGINALLREDGFNSIDFVHIAASLQGSTSLPPNYLRMGEGVVRHSDSELAGNFDYQIGQDFAGQNMTDEGSVELRFPQAVDEVLITITNEAEHPQPQDFNDGLQSWSISLGNLSFVPGLQTSVDWDDHKGQLVKDAFDLRPAAAQYVSRDGEVGVELKLDHVSTAPGLFSYNKWEIDSWGDPEGIHASQGSWQIVSNASNEVVLGVWGYWGWDGQETTPHVKVGDSTSHRLTIQFDHPVDQLSFMLNGVNALIKQFEGFNSHDVITIESYLGSVSQGDIAYRQEGDAFVRFDNILTGDYTVQINEGFSGQHISDRGSLRLAFTETVDRVVINLTNVAGHHNLALFKDGAQTWSFSVGDLSFSHSACENCPDETPESGEQTDGSLADNTPRLILVVGSTGELQLQVYPKGAVGTVEELGYSIEASTDLIQWSQLGSEQLEHLVGDSMADAWALLLPLEGETPSDRFFRLRKN